MAAACGGGGGGGDDGDVASVSGDDGDEQAASDDQETTEEELMDWAACMREEGIDIPDPVRDADGNLVIDGNGIHIGGGEMSGGIAVSQEEDADDDSDDEGPAFSPEDMQAAMEACGEPPGMGPSNMSEEDRQAQQDAAVEFAQCMRDEGIEDFPDPDFSDEGPGGELRTASPGEGPEPDEEESVTMVGPFGEIDMDDPETSAAFEACQDVLGIPEGGPGEGGPATPASGSGGDT